MTGQQKTWPSMMSVKKVTTLADLREHLDWLEDEWLPGIIRGDREIGEPTSRRPELRLIHGGASAEPPTTAERRISSTERTAG